MAEPADAPPFTQQQLLALYAERAGTLNREGGVRTQVTADALELGPDGTQKVRRWLRGEGHMRWDVSWRIYKTLGWVNENRAKMDLAQAAAREAERRARRARRKRPAQGETGT